MRNSRNILLLLSELVDGRFASDPAGLAIAATHFDQLERHLDDLPREQATDRAAVVVAFLRNVLEYDESQLRYELRHCAALCSDDALAAVLGAHSRGEH